MLTNREVKPNYNFTVYKNLCVSPFNQGAGVKICSGRVPVNLNI